MRKKIFYVASYSFNSSCFANLIAILEVHPVAPCFSVFVLVFSVYLMPPSWKWKWTEDDSKKKKKGLLSAVFDNLSLWGSLIIHASLTAYLLSFCIFLLKGMREVEGYVAIINFLYHSSGIFIKQSRMRFNKANFWISKQVSGSQYFKGCLSFTDTRSLIIIMLLESSRHASL